MVDQLYDTTKPYISKVKELIRNTWNTRLVVISEEGGNYPLIRRKMDSLEFDHTDGIGTKGLHHWRNRSFKDAVTDAMAMNLNDIAVVRGLPYKLQNHLIVPADDHGAIITIIEELCRQCIERRIAVSGGEISIQNNISGMELSLTVSSYVETSSATHFEDGQYLLGFKSSGLHSNGLTLAAKMLPDNWLDLLTTPTVIYCDEVAEIVEEYEVGAMVHLAGGAWTRLKSLCKGVNAVVGFSKAEMHIVFSHLYEAIGDDEVMYKTFNCGIGYIMAVNQGEAKSLLKKHPELMHIGYTQPGDGKVIIKSGFSDKEIVF